MKTSLFKNSTILLLLAGIFYTCTAEDIGGNFQIEDEKLTEWKHFDMQEWELLYDDRHPLDFAVEFRLKPLASNRAGGYSIIADSEVKALSLMHNATLKPSFPGTRDPVLQQYYTLTIRGSYMNVESRERGENRERYETIIEDFLATGKFDDYVREFEIAYTTWCANPVSVSDPYFRNAHGWALRMIDAPCAWTITRGDPGVLIGIVDTEFRITHEEFQGSPNQFEFVWGQSSANNHHGTEVASVAAARANNGRGIAGVAHDSRIAAHRVVHYSNGSSYSDRVRVAINNLHNAGVPIINVSWSRTGLSQVQAERITQNGTTLVISAGNNNLDQWHSYIATVPGVIVVSSVNRDNRHGPTGHARNSGVTIVAPGVDIRVAGGNSNSHYLTTHGTSFAAPFVAGTVALMLSVNPTLEPAQIESILRATADPIADGGSFHGQLGAGRLNAYRAVDAAGISGSRSCCPGATATFSIPPPPPGATVRWIPGDFLAIVGANNQATVTVRHTGVPAGVTFPAANSRIMAEISMGGRVTTLYRDVEVNRPIIRPFSVPSSLQTGVHFTFFADHNSFGRLAAIPSWRVSPNQDFNMFEQEEPCSHTMMFQFMVARNYTVTATVRNACGVDTRSVNVNVTVPAPPPPPTSCLICGFFPVHHNMPCPNPNCRAFTCPLCGFYPLHYGQSCFCVMWRGGNEEEEEKVKEEVKEE